MTKKTNRIAYFYAGVAIFFWTSTATVVKLLLTNLNSIQVLLFVSFFAGLSLLVIILFFSNIPTLQLNQVLGLLWLGIFPSGLAFVFWFLALKHGETSVMSNVVFLTPFVSLVYISVFLQETILLSSVIGLVIIISGILIQTTSIFK